MMRAAPESMPPILRGMFLLARGQAAGLNCFRDTPRAFILSLAPGLGILAGAAVENLVGAGGAGASEIPAALCVLLAPAVLSYELARFWGREAFWNRYIVAFNWCQWLLPGIAFVLVSGAALARSSGIDGQAVLRVLVVGLAGYALWLNWFIARHGLALSAWRAIGLVAAVNLGTIVLLFGPTLLAALVR